MSRSSVLAVQAAPPEPGSTGLVPGRREAHPATAGAHVGLGLFVSPP